MATLTGNLADVTNKAPENISSITVKAPAARIGGSSGSSVIVSSPATVDFNRDTGDITISNLTGGLSWLYIEGDGWSDSIALAVADGMVTLVEAVANASGVPGVADYIRLLADLEGQIEDVAQDAVDAAAENIKWVKRKLNTGEDLNTVTTPGVYWMTSTVSNTLINRPAFVNGGTLLVMPGNGSSVTQVYITDRGYSQPQMVSRTGAGDRWSIWSTPGSVPAFLPDNADISSDEFLQSGLWSTASISNAGTITGTPEEVKWQPFVLRVYRSNETATLWRTVQELTTLPYATGKPPRTFIKSVTHSGLFHDWVEATGGGEDSGTAVKIDMKRQLSRLRRGGVIGVGERTPVSLSFDHGFVNFRDKVLPHLIRLGLPATVAVNPDTLNKDGESAGVTFADLQSWSLNHGIEIAHHSRSHLDAPTLDIKGFEQAILSTIPEFETNMPEVVADAYIMPGVSGTGYDGFGAGLPPENWYTHPAGRMILSNFPVVTAAMLGQATPALGDPVQTIDRAGVDITSWAKVTEDKISSLVGTHLGMAVFNHPSRIDNRISSERFIQFLEFLASERDAGRVEVLTVSGFAYADVTSNVRANLAPTWSGSQSVIELSPMLEYYAGAQVIVETTATSGGDLTMTASSDVGGLNASVTHTATAGQKYRLVFSIPKTATTITITAPGNNRSARIV